MKFIGYTVGGMIDVAEEVYRCNSNYVIIDEGHYKLAIRMPKCNGVETFALFLYDEFADGNDDERKSIIQSKAEETIRFFQETTGVINNYIPTLLYHDIQTIVRLNNGTVEHYMEDNNTEILESENVICISEGRDDARNNFFVKIKGVVTFTFDNENSARRVYRMIKKDFSNFSLFRWGALQQ